MGVWLEGIEVECRWKNNLWCSCFSTGQVVSKLLLCFEKNSFTFLLHKDSKSCSKRRHWRQCGVKLHDMAVQKIQKIVFTVGEMAHLHILYFLEARWWLDMRKNLSLRLRSWDLVDSHRALLPRASKVNPATRVWRVLALHLDASFVFLPSVNPEGTVWPYSLES